MTIVKVKLAPGQDWRPVCVACEKRIHSLRFSISL
jgi:hypothetical protein